MKTALSDDEITPKAQSTVSYTKADEGSAGRFEVLAWRNLPLIGVEGRPLT